MSNGIGISAQSGQASARIGRDDTAQSIVNQISSITCQLEAIEDRLAETSRMLYGRRPEPASEKAETTQSEGIMADIHEGLGATIRVIDRIDSDLNYLRNRLGIS